MRTALTPRLGSLDVFASALLVALGVVPNAGCGSNVQLDDDGEGGAGGNTDDGNGAGTNTGAGNQGGSSNNGGAPPTTNVGGAGGGPNAGLCVNPQPYIIDGQDTGYDTCDGGQMRRRERAECPISGVDPNPCCGGCEEGYICSDSGEVACGCVPACKTDADCGADQVCFCGEGGGECVQALCHTGEDCGQGQECTSWDPTQGCLYVAFACTTVQDQCGGDLDCDPELPLCTVQADGHRQCDFGGCAIGRPFLVEETAITASIEARGDWSDGTLRPSLDGLSTEVRAELASAWQLIGRMEHASVAAFARFAMQLMAFGAPADLIERTTRAMADETRHTRMAFALAGAYGGSPVGPGALPIDGALDGANDIASVVRLVIREGCVGETVAALEAAEAAEAVGDPSVKRVLTTIAAEESQHSELAWRSVKWALDTFGADVAAVIDEEICLIEEELTITRRGRGQIDTRLLAHGVVSAELRAQYRRTALQRAILPCLRALVEQRVALAA